MGMKIDKNKFKTLSRNAYFRVDAKRRENGGPLDKYLCYEDCPYDKDIRPNYNSKSMQVIQNIFKEGLVFQMVLLKSKCKFTITKLDPLTSILR